MKRLLMGLLFCVSVFCEELAQSLLVFDHTLQNVACDMNTDCYFYSYHTKLIVMQGDITQIKSVDAIVNAANPQLAGGGGVCGAIFSAAGDKALQEACNAYVIQKGTPDIRCPVGQACITPSFGLEKNGIKFIIHAVGPDCRIIKNRKEQVRLLTSAYQTSLQLADEKGLSSIAFPFISSAIYACPLELAAVTAIDALAEYVHTHPTTNLRNIYIVLFTPKDKKLFDEMLYIDQLIRS